MAYHRTYGVRTNIARIFNTYGPRMQLKDGQVVPAFLDQVLNGEALTVFGSGYSDAQLLLCFGPGLWARSALPIRGTLSREPGESTRDDNSGVCRLHSESLRRVSSDRLQAAARRRSQEEAAGYYQGESDFRMGSRRSRSKTGFAKPSSIFGENLLSRRRPRSSGGGSAEPEPGFLNSQSDRVVIVARDQLNVRSRPYAEFVEVLQQLAIALEDTPDCYNAYRFKLVQRPPAARAAMFRRIERDADCREGIPGLL